ncbi:MAG: hypothetical protein LC795_08425 [Acidobacteria bacterium]|nr:hypothetical protein [Acidobacteriota bacterium]
MSKHVRAFAHPSLVLALLLLAAAAPAAWPSHAGAQSVLTGEWTASIDSDAPDRLQLNLERRTEKGGRSQVGQDHDFSELRGLTREQVRRGGAVKFGLEREAGTIECEGSFRDGRGSGTFRFTGSQSFVSAMKSRGFDFEEDEGPRGDGREHENRLFAAASLNVTTALADDLLSAGFNRLEVGDLFKAAIFKVDSKFARELKAAGLPDLGMEDLVKARIFKLDAAYISEVARMGFAGQPMESLVKMRIFKVTPEFIAEARGEGLTDLSIEDLVKMKIFKIDSAFIRRAKADGVPLEVEELVRRRIGVRDRNFQE